MKRTPPKNKNKETIWVFIKSWVLQDDCISFEQSIKVWFHPWTFWELVPHPRTHDFRVHTPQICYSSNHYGETSVTPSAPRYKFGLLESCYPSHSQYHALVQRKFRIVTSWLSRLQSPNSLFVSVNFIWSLFTSFWFMLLLDGERYVNALLPMDLVPLTITH